MAASIPTIRRTIPNRVKVVRALHEGGAKIVAGTDTGMPLVPTGLGLHWELKIFVDQAGFKPIEALEAATIHAAECLGVKDIGAIEVGRNADLVLLDESPLEDIENLSKVSGVMVQGRWMDTEEIDKQLSRMDQQAAEPRR